MQITKDTLIWVGITALVATTAASLLSSGIINDAQNDGSFDIVSAEIKRGSTGSAILEINVRNSGSDTVVVQTAALGYPIEDATVAVSIGSGKNQCEADATDADSESVSLIFGDTSGNGEDAVSLDRGGVTTLICTIPESDDMKYGESYTLSISGTVDDGDDSTDGRTVSDTSVVYVTTGF